MKVLLISSEYPFGRSPKFGGGGSHVFYLTQVLVELGAEVLLLTHAGATKEGTPLERSRRLRIFPCKFGAETALLNSPAIESALQICRTEKPNVVHGHHFQGALVGLNIAASLALPMVLTMHKPPRFVSARHSKSSPVYTGDPAYAVWRTFAVDPRIKAHIAYSGVYKDEMLEIGVPEDNIRTIRHGVPVEYLRNKRHRRLPMPRRFGINPGETVILCPMRPEKLGVETFIKAASLVRDRAGSRYALRFIITGDPKRGSPASQRKARSHIELAKSHSLGHLMNFRGFTLRQMWELFHRSQVCVVPTFREGLGIALLEAMSVGCPVVASEVTGVNEVIEDGVSGLLVQPGDAEKLADAIVRVITDRALASRLTKEAGVQVKRDFDAERMGREHIALYEELLSRGEA